MKQNDARLCTPTTLLYAPSINHCSSWMGKRRYPVCCACVEGVEEQVCTDACLWWDELELRVKLGNPVLHQEPHHVEAHEQHLPGRWTQWLPAEAAMVPSDDVKTTSHLVTAYSVLSCA